ncbi:hypothetical protein JCM6882_007489 [Rhodosporidiobolus microsporus]
MASSPSPAPQPPRRTINDLPAELKKRIVELVAQQDDAYEEWTTALRPKLKGPMRVVLDAQKVRFKNGLGALFRVSRQWSELAAPLRFKILRASRANLNFQMHVMHTRGRHMRYFELDASDPALLAPALSVLAHAPQVDVLTLHRCVFEYGDRNEAPIRLYNYHKPPLASHLVTTLHRLAKTTTSVRLVDFSPSDVYGVMDPWLRTVSSLHLQMSARAFEDKVSDLGDFLSKAAALVELRLTIMHTVDHEVGDWGEIDFEPLIGSLSTRARPPLRALSIKVPLFHISTSSFAALFSSTLTSLDLIFSGNEAEDDFDDPPLDTHPFPLLHTLRVRGSWVVDTIRSIKGSSFPSLHHLELGLEDLWSFDEGNSGVPLKRILAEMPQLRSARVHGGSPLVPGLAQELEDMAKPYPRLQAFQTPDWPSCPASPFSSPNLGAPYYFFHTAAINPAAEFVHRLAHFLNNELVRTSKIGDEAALLPLVEALRPLELERLARTG